VAESPLVKSTRATRRVRCRERHRVQRVGDGVQVPPGQMQIDERVFQLAVTEEQLAGAQIRARFEQMGRETMAQRILTLPMNRLPRSFTTVTIPSTRNT